MRGIAIVVASMISTPVVHAEITQLGSFRLGSPRTKAGFVKSAEALGCTGSLSQASDKRDKMIEVSFRPDGKCDRKALEAAIEKDYGTKPIVSTDKTARLWEGKTASVLVSTGISGDLRVTLLPPGGGSKRPCFADDGFPAFFKTFTAALDKPADAAAQFKFPVKDFEGKVVIKDAKALAKQWPSLIDGDDKKELTSGTVKATCEVGTGTYSLGLSNSNLSFEARKVGESWQWVEINSVSPG